VVVGYFVLAAKTAGIRFDAIPGKRGCIAQYCAMLSMYAVADGWCCGYSRQRTCAEGSKRVEQVVDFEEISHGKLDTHRYFVYV
jgi:hypothetical protein